MLTLQGSARTKLRHVEGAAVAAAFADARGEQLAR
jgi:hypothetical protein